MVHWYCIFDNKISSAHNRDREISYCPCPCLSTHSDSTRPPARRHPFFPVVTFTPVDGFVRTLNAFRSECWTGSDQNPEWGREPRSAPGHGCSRGTGWAAPARAPSCVAQEKGQPSVITESMFPCGSHTAWEVGADAMQCDVAKAKAMRQASGYKVRRWCCLIRPT